MITNSSFQLPVGTVWNALDTGINLKCMCGPRGIQVLCLVRIRFPGSLYYQMTDLFSTES